VLAGPSDAVLAEFEGEPATLLTRRERARMHAFRNPADATDYLAAHLLVRLAAGRVSGRPVGTLTVQQTCPTCG